MSTRTEHIDWLLLKAYEKLHSEINGSARQDRRPGVNDAVAAVEFLRHERWQAINRSKSRRRK